MIKIIFRKQFSKIIRPHKIDYNKLIDNTLDLSHDMEKAFGPESHGVMCISNIPELERTRFNILNDTFQLGQQPKEKLKSIVLDDKLSLRYGWVDELYYSKNMVEHNMIKSFTGRYPELSNHSQNIIKQETKNIWPTFMPKFKENFFNISQLISDCQLNLLKHLDKYLKPKIHNFKSLFQDLYSKYGNTNRLVYYLPLSDYKSTDEANKYNWGEDWHIDFGLLTTITHPMYIDKNTGKESNGECSLFIKRHKGEESEVVFENNELITFGGDILYILSGGKILTTPHCVKNNRRTSPDFYRVNMVSFLDPQLSTKIEMPEGITFQKLIEMDPMHWELRNSDYVVNGMDFGQFTTQAKDELFSLNK